jgi:HTH-type transcriptional regulator/antitoxin MqsA
MTCEVCGIGQRQPQQVAYSLRVADQLVVVEHVPASVCDHCGEASFSPDTVEQLQRTIWQSRSRGACWRRRSTNSLRVTEISTVATVRLARPQLPHPSRLTAFSRIHSVCSPPLG